MTYVVVLEFEGEPYSDYDGMGQIQEHLRQLREMVIPPPRMTYLAIDDPAERVLGVLTREAGATS